jgi:hypothetical protein
VPPSKIRAIFDAGPRDQLTQVNNGQQIGGPNGSRVNIPELGSFGAVARHEI